MEHGIYRTGSSAICLWKILLIAAAKKRDIMYIQSRMNRQLPLRIVALFTPLFNTSAKVLVRSSIRESFSAYSYIGCCGFKRNYVWLFRQAKLLQDIMTLHNSKQLMILKQIVDEMEHMIVNCAVKCTILPLAIMLNDVLMAKRITKIHQDLIDVDVNILVLLLCSFRVHTYNDTVRLIKILLPYLSITIDPGSFWMCIMSYRSDDMDMSGSDYIVKNFWKCGILPDAYFQYKFPTWINIDEVFPRYRYYGKWWSKMKNSRCHLIQTNGQ